jgi:hypothetical protein|tara:strand:- start:70 stop:663 length:594 start_codon:yes stop_codon:yes gene_type:complete
MFGFGKEKVGYSFLASIYKAACYSWEKELHTAWSSVEGLPGLDNIAYSEEVRMAIEALALGTLEFALPQKYKEEFNSLAKMISYREYSERESKLCLGLESFYAKSEKVDIVMSDAAQGSPDLSFLAGILILVGVPSNKLDGYIRQLNIHFNVDIFQGAIIAYQGLVENKKFVLDDIDNELISWFNETVSMEIGENKT